MLTKSQPAGKPGEVMPIIPDTGYANFTRGTGVMVVPLPPANARNAYNPEPLPSTSVIGRGAGRR